MARFNEILVGRHNRFLQKYFGLKGGPPSPQLSSEVQPTFELESAMNVENRFVHSWRIFGGFGFGAAGGAGNRSAVQLFNPATSGVIAIIEKVTYFSSATDTPSLTRSALPTGLTTGVGQGSRDLRAAAVSSCLLKTSVNAGAVGGFILWEGSVPAANNQVDVIQTHNQELALLPGDNYTLFGGTLNQAVNVSFFWRERAQEEGEIS